MSNYHKALHAFYQGKANKIKKLGITVPYYSEKDKEHLFSLPDKKVKTIWKKLSKNIESTYTFGLNKDVCVACIEVNDDCEKCKYAKTHGRCNIGGDDFRKIIDYFYRINESTVTIFTNEFYKTLIKRCSKFLREDEK